MKKKKEENLITWKIKYVCDDDFSEFISQYNCLLRFTYNRIKDNTKVKTPDLNNIQKTANNCELMNSWFRTCAEYEARAMLSANPDGNSIFGGKQLFIDRCRQKITREEFLKKRQMPLYSIGEANQSGNRLFTLVDCNSIIFRPNRNSNFILRLASISNKRCKVLSKIADLQNQKQIALTYKLDTEFIYITFDYNLIKKFTYNVKENRIFAIDLNPNSIGWSVVDWRGEFNYNVIQAGTISLKPLNDYRSLLGSASDDARSKYVTNKRNFEIVEISKQLFNFCRHYKCEVFSVEDLNMISKDNKKGKGYNRLVNNMWNRNLLVNQIKKRIKASSTKMIEVQPQYNSYIGNLIFRNLTLPDECLASIEIGRRGWEFSTQYIFNRRPNKKVVIYPDLKLVKNQLSISLEEIGIDVPSLDDWMSILQKVKESKTKYRFSSSSARKQHSERLFSKFYKRRFCLLYEYL